MIWKMLKDYNDLHTQGIPIDSLETVPLDMQCLNIMLSDAKDKQEEYKIARRFCKTVKDSMVKADMSKMLSKRWEQDIETVKEYIDVSVDTDEEILSQIHGFDDSFADFRKFISEEGEGLGFKSIDQSLGGMKRKEVCILGAYSNQGKSFVAAKMVAFRILNYNDNVLIFSMEETRGQFLKDIICEIMQMNEQMLKAYMETDEGVQIYDKVREKLETKLIIVDTPNKTVDDMFKYTEVAMRNGFNVDFVVFDHFHLIPRVDEFSVMKDQADKLKIYVKKFNVRLIMLAQFNEESQRSFGQRKTDYEATMSHVKGANDLKAIADIILLLWRPYKTDTNRDAISRESIKYITRIKIGKARRGVRGAEFFQYEYDPQTTGFKEYIPEESEAV